MKKHFGKITAYAVTWLVLMAIAVLAVHTLPAFAASSAQYDLVLPSTVSNNLDDHTYQWIVLTSRSTMRTVTAATGAPGASALTAAAYWAKEDDTFKRWGWQFTGLSAGTYLFSVYGSADTTADIGDTFLKNGVFDWDGKRIVGDPRVY
jgi:hypothetical protein